MATQRGERIEFRIDEVDHDEEEKEDKQNSKQRIENNKGLGSSSFLSPSQMQSERRKSIATDPARKSAQTYHIQRLDLKSTATSKPSKKSQPLLRNITLK